MLQAVIDARLAAFRAQLEAHAGLWGHWKFDETSGTTFSDSSGNGRDMTIVGGTTAVLGVAGLESSTGVAVSTGSALDFRARRAGLTATQAGAMTFIKLVKITTLTGAGIAIAHDNFSGQSGLGVLHLTGTGNADLRTSIRIGATTTIMTVSGHGMVAGGTYLLAVTWDGTTMRLYKDGAELGNTTPAVGGNAQLHGASYWACGLGSANSLSGVHDETATYTACWTPTEIANLNAVRS